MCLRVCHILLTRSAERMVDEPWYLAMLSTVQKLTLNFPVDQRIICLLPVALVRYSSGSIQPRYVSLVSWKVKVPLHANKGNAVGNFQPLLFSPSTEAAVWPAKSEVTRVTAKHISTSLLLRCKNLQFVGVSLKTTQPGTTNKPLLRDKHLQCGNLFSLQRKLNPAFWNVGTVETFQRLFDLLAEKCTVSTPHTDRLVQAQNMSRRRHESFDPTHRQACSSSKHVEEKSWKFRPPGLA